MGRYFTAEVCPNGHVTTDAVEDQPEHTEPYCSRCGEATIRRCTNCDTLIRGHYEPDDVPGLHVPYDPPAYCFNCGESFPWTERRMSSALELLEMAGTLTEDEITQTREDLPELVKDSPRVQPASARFGRVLGKVGSSVGTGVRELLVDIVSETAKRAIWGK